MIDLYEIFEAILLEGMPIPELYEKFYKSKVPSLEDFITLNSLDPTSSPDTKGKYLDFIVNKLYIKQYNKDISKMSDNKPTIKNSLSVFTKVKGVDINSLSSLSDIEAANAKVTKSRTDVKKDIDKIYDKDGWTVIVPKTEAASQAYGKNTKWCTSALDDCKFSKYNRDGILFIIIHNTGNITSKYQFHASYKEFSDELNVKLSADKINKFPPEVITSIVTYKYPDDYYSIINVLTIFSELGYDISKLSILYKYEIVFNLVEQNTGDLPALKRIIEILKDKINTVDNDGNTILTSDIMGASLDSDILKIILKYMTQETISAVSNNNTTVLHSILSQILSSHLNRFSYSSSDVREMFTILLYKGADKCINIINHNNETPLSLVCQRYTNPKTKYSEYPDLTKTINLLLKYKADANINSITKTAYAKYIQMLKG